MCVWTAQGRRRPMMPPTVVVRAVCLSGCKEDHREHPGAGHELGSTSAVAAETQPRRRLYCFEESQSTQWLTQSVQQGVKQCKQ